MSTIPWYENDPLLAELVGTGHEYAVKLGQRIADHGLYVRVTPLRVRESFDRRVDFKDEFDLVVDGDKVIECKSRNLKFTGPHDYPYRTAFVYSVNGWRAKTIRPVAIVLVSQPTMGIAVIPASSEPHWSVKQGVHDHIRGLTYDAYEVPRDRLITFEAMIGWLRNDWGPLFPL